MTDGRCTDRSSKLAAALRREQPGRVATGEAIRRRHANTLTGVANEPPDAVVWPETAGEVARIVDLAARHGAPVIPFGAGTSLEGHVNAPLGGVCLDMSAMNRILAVRARDLDCTVEAGVTLRQLNERLRAEGLFFPVDPGDGGATLGGMAATRASGTTTLRYGAMRENVLGLAAVLANGSIVRTGGRARKSAAGYDLTRLLVGSEGTLGVITELSLRLRGIPRHVIAGAAAFPSVEAACAAAIEAIQAGAGLARIELMDADVVRIVNGYSGLALAEAPALFVEAHGGPAAAREAMDIFATIAASHRARGFAQAENEEARRRLWRARHDAFRAIKAARPGRAALVTDVCVPVSRLADCISETRDDARAAGIDAPILGHVGDGNFHAIPLYDAEDERQRGQIAAFVSRLSARAITMEGTCSGEHGIGQGKIAALAAEAGASLDMMRAIKRALDPHGVFNPGKIFTMGDV